ncbi:MAG: leucyl/phenylalanyl-tRNA--protein transferase [Bacteroidota bacterium]|nr:leucyl/phenylalanyl-tRNA--protein transferase [Bacteroidota bacterium]
MIDSSVLLYAYSRGIFPMAESRDGEIRWYEPERRAVFPIETLKFSRSLRRVLRKNIFGVRFDTAFEDVIRSCADREETWISETIVQSYVKLFEEGYAHSVESWCDDELAGGLYGVALGGAFFGESMFSRRTDASKVAFAALVQRLRERNFSLLDAQYMTPHLHSLGALEISKEEYLRRLSVAVKFKCNFL